MKRMIALLLLVVMICTSLCSCSSNTNSNSNSDGMDYDSGATDGIYGEESDVMALENPNTHCNFDKINGYYSFKEGNCASEDNYVFYTTSGDYGDEKINMCVLDSDGELIGTSELVDLEYEVQNMCYLLDVPTVLQSYDREDLVTSNCYFLQAVGGYIYWADDYSIWRLNYLEADATVELFATTGFPLLSKASRFYIKGEYLFTCINEFERQKSASEIVIKSGFALYDINEKVERDLAFVNLCIPATMINKSSKIGQNQYADILSANSEEYIYFAFNLSDFEHEDNSVRMFNMETYEISNIGIVELSYMEDNEVRTESISNLLNSTCRYDYFATYKMFQDIINNKYTITDSKGNFEYGVTDAGVEWKATSHEVYVNNELVVSESNEIRDVFVDKNYIYYYTSITRDKYYFSRVDINTGKYQLLGEAVIYFG